jgi:penicillin-binding protein A
MRRGLLWTMAFGGSLLATAALVGRRAWSAPPAAPARPAGPQVEIALVQAAPRPDDTRAIDPGPAPRSREAPDEQARARCDGRPVAGLDLTRIALGDGAPTAPAAAGTARLTLDADLQRTAAALMAARRFPESAVVLMDVASGRLLVYASHVEKGPARDLCAEATAPSASVFKIVTAAALVEDAHLGPDTRQCYLGGEQHIRAADLVEDPARDRWCTTLGGALGRSVNAVFARLASTRLAPQGLDAMARRFGYGQPLSFDVPVQASAVRMPDDPLEFARTAAGFWNTTLSPLQAAEMSAIVARRGEAVRPRVVDALVAPSGGVLWSASLPEACPAHAGARAIAPDTADKVAAMMGQTVRAGTCVHAFHDARGSAYLPGVAVAGKTGTLTDAQAQRYYTWFTGFAPTEPLDGVPEVAVAVLVVNGPVWREKANVLARDVLRAYFASHGVTGVTWPATGAIARRERR